MRTAFWECQHPESREEGNTCRKTGKEGQESTKHRRSKLLKAKEGDSFRRTEDIHQDPEAAGKPRGIG